MTTEYPTDRTNQQPNRADRKPRMEGDTMSNATDRYRQHLDQLYSWLREDRRAIERANDDLWGAYDTESRRVALKALAAAATRAAWCNDRIEEMAGAHNAN